MTFGLQSWRWEYAAYGSIHIFLQRPWWTRAWIRQEYCLGEKRTYFHVRPQISVCFPLEDRDWSPHSVAAKFYFQILYN